VPLLGIHQGAKLKGLGIATDNIYQTTACLGRHHRGLGRFLDQGNGLLQRRYIFIEALLIDGVALYQILF